MPARSVSCGTHHHIIFQGSQNGSDPDVNSGRGYPGLDWPSQLQHGRQPAPESLLLQVHHLRIWPTNSWQYQGSLSLSLVLRNLSDCVWTLGGGDWICFVVGVLLIVSFLKRDWNFWHFLKRTFQYVADTGSSQLLSAPLYFYGKQNVDMMDCPPVWDFDVDQCLILD